MDGAWTVIIRKILLLPVCIFCLLVMCILYIVATLVGICVFMWRMAGDMNKELSKD